MVQKKMVCVGDGGTGKTVLLYLFVNGCLPEYTGPTGMSGYRSTYVAVQVDAVEVELALWDTPGQEDYDRLRPLFYPDTDVILMVFSVDLPSSLENILGKWLPEVKRFCRNVPIVLVGTNKELRDDESTKWALAKTKETPVTFEQGVEMAQTIKAVQYVECSPKLNEGVTDACEVAARAALYGKRKKK